MRSYKIQGIFKFKLVVNWCFMTKMSAGMHKDNSQAVNAVKNDFHDLSY